MSKKCTPLWREAHLEVKMLKTLGVRTTFGSSDVEKVHAVVARSTFWSQKCKNWRVLSTFGRSDALSSGRRKGLCTLSKVSKTWRFCSISKSDGRRGTFEEDLQRCKHSVSRLSYLFAHLHLLASDSFSSLICSLLLFSSLCLCPSLLFICPHIVGSLTSKLPSTIYTRYGQNKRRLL